MSNTRFQVVVTLLALTCISSVYAQNRENAERSIDNKGEVTRVEDSPSAIELLHDAGIVPDFQFLPDDLAALPASFWPLGLSYDMQTGELVFEGKRMDVQEVPKGSVHDREAQIRGTESTKIVYVEEKVVTRMFFTESLVSDKGDIILAGPDGYVQLGISLGGRFTVMVHPPMDDVDAFYPMTYYIEMGYLTA